MDTQSPAQSVLLPRTIRDARETRGWTQTDLARRLSVSQGTISFWERGIEAPTLPHLVALVTALPELFTVLGRRENELLARVYELERELNSGKCLCKGCGCSD